MYKTMNFDWLTDTDTASPRLTTQDGDSSWQPYPFAPEVGHGGFEILNMTMGMAVFRAEHHFLPEAMGQMIPLAKVERRFPEPCFAVQTVRHGRILHRESIPPQELLFSPGHDLFRHADRLDLVPLLDTSSSSEMISLCLADSILAQLLGEEIAKKLLATLTLEKPPTVIVRSVPLHVTAALHHSLPTSLQGPIRKLHCQAKSLEYLSLLAQHLCIDPETSAPTHRRRQTYELREHLLSLNGKLPTLDELARRFGRCSRTLNDDFIAEHGQSIYSFIREHRLNEAKAALLNSDLPLKTLAARLGYAHVNHFSAAFKKQFGQAPSSLRGNI